MTKDVFLVGAVRTPIGTFMGGLSPLEAPKMGSTVIQEALKRAGVAPEGVDEVIMGNVLQAGVGQNPARQAALGAGLPPSISPFTVNKVCGSGLKSVMLAAQAIKAGDGDIIVAGGMESMSQAPFLLSGARKGFKLGHQKMTDHMVSDGLTDAFDGKHMGFTAELIHETYHISREASDAYSVSSHLRAAKAWKEGAFDWETTPVTVKKRHKEVVINRDEGIRDDSNIEGLARLRPVFKEDGHVTAGNASQISDGAGAVVVMSGDAVKRLGVKPLARVVSYATAGLEPKWVMATPREAVPLALSKAGWDISSVDVFELNEAFAVQSVYLLEALKLDPEKVNVHGGAVAIGHPLGASGTRCLVTLLGAMRAKKSTRGVVSLCLGGGNGVAMALEAESLWE